MSMSHQKCLKCLGGTDRKEPVQVQAMVCRAQSSCGTQDSAFKSHRCM